MKKMKKLIKMAFAATLVAVFIFSCTDKADKEAVHWINNSKKPIICKGSRTNFNYERQWTLINADGKIFTTGFTSLNLPDTINGN